MANNSKINNNSKNTTATKVVTTPATTTGQIKASRIGSKWSNLSTYASRLYFLIILLQLPLFRIQCRSGMCMTPIHVTSSQLVASDVFPLPVVKTLLYPGAIVHGLINNFTVPSWNDLMPMYNLTDIKNASAVPDLQRLEVLAGSYFSVAGSLIGIIKPGRMSMFGMLLVVWGLVKEGILKKAVDQDPATAVFVYPTMLIAVVSAFLSVKYNVKKAAARSAAPQPIAKPLKSSRKSKLK